MNSYSPIAVELSQEHIDLNPMLDREGRALFSINDEIRLWLDSHNIEWDYKGKTGVLMGFGNTCVEYIEVTHLLFDKPNDAILFKLTF